MANKMLIDATHPEETRVVVLRGNRVEEFDFESANRKQLRGNIYLAKVTRVEPSLQAAFVDYGGNRHGFLAFSEIHPDYYQIPVADRQALIDEEGRAQREADDEVDRRSRRHRHRGRPARRDEEVVRGDSAELPSGDFAAADHATDFAAADQTAEPHEDGHNEASGEPADITSAETTDLQSDVRSMRLPKRVEENEGGIVPEETHADEAEDLDVEEFAGEVDEFRFGRTRSGERPKYRRARSRRETRTMGRMRAAKTATARPTVTRPRKKSSSSSAAPTPWKRFPIAPRAIAASTKSRK